jgi:6,7-dimethyl-8-ribityllumazine synthase
VRDSEHSSRDAKDRLSAEGRRFGLVASRFNGALVDRLLDGAVECLIHHGAGEEDLVSVRVPGAFEIPLALRELAERAELDALVALGVVIRGETPHFDYVCAEASRGIQRVSIDLRIPIGFGVLTCDTLEQAEARAGGEAGNKGWEAALAALEMTDLVDRLRHGRL